MYGEGGTICFKTKYRVFPKASQVEFCDVWFQIGRLGIIEIDDFNTTTSRNPGIFNKVNSTIYPS